MINKGKIMSLPKNLLLTALLASSAVFSAIANAGVVDTIEAPTGYFVPDASDTYSSPYYRGNGSDWSWTHNAIASSFTTASLNISAFDVDFTSSGYLGERDMIQAYDTNTSTWLDLGYLSGANDIYSFTNFDLDYTTWVDEIQAGLQVRMLIDLNDEGWYVTLAKSVLTTDGEDAGNPNPGTTVPVPAAAWLFGSAMAGLIGLRRRKSA
jgi:hypothetical protein